LSPTSFRLAYNVLTVRRLRVYMRNLLAALALLILNVNAYADSSAPLAGVTILVLGECHMCTSGTLISNLPDRLVFRGANVFTYGAWGASPQDWLKATSVPCTGFRKNTGPIRTRPADIATTQPIGDLIRKHRPNLVVLVMGDTVASYDSKELPKSWVWQNVSSLTNEIKKYGTRCVWVGPSWVDSTQKKNNQRVKELSEYLSNIVAPCTYVDSLTFSDPGEWKTKDGMHYFRWGYNSWAEGITTAITSPEILDTIPR
jgi:hypothetical protein